MRHKAKHTAVMGMRFPPQLKKRIEISAAKLDRSKSWIVKRCVELSLAEIERLASFENLDPPQGGMQMAA